MDETQSLFPGLPPKRKPPLTSAIDAHRAPELAQNSAPKEITGDDENFLDESDIDPELLADFEQALKDTPTSVEIGELSPPRGAAVEAPIVGDCVDPLAVPMGYLLEQARKSTQRDDPPQVTADSNQSSEQEK